MSAHRPFGLAAIVLLLVGMPTHGNAQPGKPPAAAAAYVADARGNWFVARYASHSLVIGDTLLAGDVLHAASAPSETSSITVVLRSGSLVSGHCAVAASRASVVCPPLTVPSEVPGRASQIGRLIELVMAQFRKEPVRYESTMGRGVGSRLRDGVALLRDGRVDLDSVLAEVHSGRYEVCLTAVDGSADVASEPCMSTMTSDWSPGQSKWLRIKGMHPGLYELRLPDDNSVGTALVLVSGAAQYSARQAEFAKLSKQVASWQETLTAPAQQRILRAYLDAVAASDKSTHQGRAGNER